MIDKRIMYAQGQRVRFRGGGMDDMGMHGGQYWTIVDQWT
jgi:hypothetical protein